MNCEQAQALLADYFQDAVEDDARAQLERHWRNCAECGELVEFWRTLGRVDPAAGEQPAPELGGRVQLMIEAFRVGQAERNRNALPGAGQGPGNNAPTPWFQRWRLGLLAAGIILALAAGLAGGLAIGSQRGSSARELQALRREMFATRQLVTLSLLQQQSASDRLQGITWSYSMARPAPQVTTALLDTAKHDASVNVRLAAIDALQRLDGDPAVRRGLAEAFAAQQSPLVQIAIIDSFAQMREPEAATFLRSLRREDRRSQGGKFRVQIDKSVRASVGGGGPEIRFKTFNGNIYIRKGGQ